MQWNTLQVAMQPPVIRVKIYRPAENNSINAELTHELAAVLRLAEDEDSLRVLVLEGGPTIFSSGLDFAEYSRSAADATFELDAASYFDVLKAMAQSSKVIVSLVTGRVNAGGVGFVAASDLVIAGPNASFALSELLFGLLPACVLPFLIRRIGFQKAQQMALTTQPLGVEEAHRAGLVDEPAADPEQALRRRMPRLARVSPEAVRRLKAYMRELWIIQDRTRDLAVGTIAGLLNQPQTQESIRRFVSEGVLPWQ